MYRARQVFWHKTYFSLTHSKTKILNKIFCILIKNISGFSFNFINTVDPRGVPTPQNKSTLPLGVNLTFFLRVYSSEHHDFFGPVLFLMPSSYIMFQTCIVTCLMLVFYLWPPHWPWVHFMISCWLYTSLTLQLRL